MMQRNCPVCETKLTGRTDKKFCSDKCKSIEHYVKRRKNEPLFFKIDRQLKINRKILKRYNVSGYTTIRKSQLLNEGFNPKFFTHYWKNAAGDVYLFVYEFGFLSLKKNGKDKYLLIKWQDYMA